MREIDRALLMPPSFAQGLDRWSPLGGDPAGPSLADDADARLVHGDEMLGDCLELRLRKRVIRVRWMGETPLLVGRILRLSIRARTVAGRAPVLRMAGRPGAPGGRPLLGSPEAGRDFPLDPRRVGTATATVARGTARPGLDLAWPETAIFGHFGFDLMSTEGAVVRLDRLRIALLPRS